jgi:hypothetical protein
MKRTIEERDLLECAARRVLGDAADVHDAQPAAVIALVCPAVLSVAQLLALGYNGTRGDTYMDIEVMVDRLDRRTVVPCEHGLCEVLDVPDIGHCVRVVRPSYAAESDAR